MEEFSFKLLAPDNSSSEASSLSFKCFSWNIEGIRRNIHSLKYFADLHKPDLIFLSEPQIFQCDIKSLFRTLEVQYSYHLNSEDLLQPDLPLEQSKAKGGTLAVWKLSIDPFITVIPTSSPSVLAIAMTIPGHPIACHIGIYLPTSGQENEFLSALSCLDSCLSDIVSTYDDPIIFIRGDANVNPKNKSRVNVFKHLVEKYNFAMLDLSHPTYHHFLGQGEFDSPLDVILHVKHDQVSETVRSIVCKLEHPLIQSHHDLIISSFSLPICNEKFCELKQQVKAPRIENNRVKIYWTDEGIENYQAAVGDNLARLRVTWCEPSSPALMSILLSSTYSLLSSAAISTNKSVPLGITRSPKSRPHPEIEAAKRILLEKHKILFKLKSNPQLDPDALHLAKQAHSEARSAYRKTVRAQQRDDGIARDEKLFSVRSPDPAALFRAIKGNKSQSSSKIHELKVQNTTYRGESVPDGFFDSLLRLKSPEMTPIHTSPHFQNTLSDYEHILEICKLSRNVPAISYRRAVDILLSLRAEVNDFYSITASHFINAGKAGFEHFFFLLSALMKNIKLASLEELNTVWACILYKGHGKNKNSDRSYRTISTCPLLAKALDTYIGQLYGEGWSEVQAPTQFQGSGSSHELAAILLTECIQHSLYAVKKPAFVLLLDAKSAFDKVVRECAVRNAYLAGTTDQALLYVNSRLKHRKTFVEWDKVLMGPILDKLGVEQGGKNSGEIYKLCNNVQLSTAQRSGLGVSMGPVTVSSIGQADDTALISDCLIKLYCLLYLAVQYCQQYHVELVSEKTKLLAFSPKSQSTQVDIQMISNPLSLDGHKISFSSSAEHVGILRSVDGNMPNILDRFSSHKNSLRAILPSGMALGHRGNPAASLHLERLYACPVLLSGLSALVHSNLEMSAIHHYYKVHIQRLQRLHQATPECVVMFLAGSLPATALLDLKMLGHLGMIARLGPNHILHQHGRHTLLNDDRINTNKSWFANTRSLCQQYNLPDPLLVLQSPPSHPYWKTLTKAKVLDWWQVKFRGIADHLDSLEFFKTSFMSLSRPHPIWTTAGSPFEISKAVITARMLSGRYRTDLLMSNWSTSNPDGLCRLPGCDDEIGSLKHILLECSGLSEARAKAVSHWSSFLVPRPWLFPVVAHHTLGGDQLNLQFLLDPSVLPMVISLNRSNPEILPSCFYLARTWNFTIHLTREKIRKLWNMKN